MKDSLECCTDAPPLKTWEQVLAALYDAAAPRILLYGRALGLGHSESEDVLHDVFAAMLTLVNPPENLENYVTRSFRNQALNYRRTWWRRVARELESRRWFEATEPLEPREAMAVRCLQKLPVEQREVIVLKLWQKMTFEEIATLQGVSPHTAAGRFRYGLQKIRNCLLDVGPGDEIEGNEYEHNQYPRTGTRALALVATSAAARGSS